MLLAARNLTVPAYITPRIGRLSHGLPVPFGHSSAEELAYPLPVRPSAGLI